jgi:hypothetical protein
MFGLNYFILSICNYTHRFFEIDSNQRVMVNVFWYVMCFSHMMFEIVWIWVIEFFNELIRVKFMLIYKYE